MCTTCFKVKTLIQQIFYGFLLHIKQFVNVKEESNLIIKV